jgi:hypothetical protein
LTFSQSKNTTQCEHGAIVPSGADNAGVVISVHWRIADFPNSLKEADREIS